MKKGFLANGEMLGWEPGKLCSFIKETGYDCVELIDGVIFADGKNGEDYKRAADSAGISVSEILCQRDLVVKNEDERRKNVTEITENIRRASAMGVDTVNLFTGPVPWIPDPLKVGAGITMTDAWGMVFDAFDIIVPCAEKEGVRVAVENVWGMLAHDLYTNKFLISHYDSDSLGVNLDPSHDALYGNTDTAFIVKSWGKKIFHVHVKDAVGVPESGKYIFPLLGEGIVDFGSFFSALKETGYDGCVSVEFESWAYRANILGGMHSAAAKPSLDFLNRFI